MVATPGAIPVTVPVGLMIAIEGVALLHVPPGDASLSVVVRPWHIEYTLPDIEPGNGKIVSDVVVTQPVGRV